jgi:Ni,Fe-hydrogenase maturation factor
MKDVLVFGNVLVEQDNLPLKLIPRLSREFSDLNFVEMDPNEEIQVYGRELLILDTIQGIDDIKEFEIREIEDFDKIEEMKVLSMHDFDLGFNLKLLKKMNLIDSVRIIGVPVGISERKGFEGVKRVLNKGLGKYGKNRIK